jgi:hypothetical protein
VLSCTKKVYLDSAYADSVRNRALYRRGVEVSLVMFACASGKTFPVSVTQSSHLIERRTTLIGSAVVEDHGMNVYCVTSIWSNEIQHGVNSLLP